MKYDTIIFDLDGTLLDTLDDLTDSINQMLEQKGYPPRTRDEIREYIGNGAKKLVMRALPEGISDDEAAECLKVYRGIYLENMFEKTQPYDGIEETLKKLKSMGIRVGVVSNKPDEATSRMCLHYFGDMLDAVVGDSPERKKKPAPDNLYEVIRRLGEDGAKILYVGDSDVDMETARNAGLDSAGVAWGYCPKELLRQHGANYIVEAAEQLITLVEDRKQYNEKPEKKGEII
jgi:phosphoglycolate phosphatase